MGTQRPQISDPEPVPQKARNTRFIRPTPGPDPLRELKAGLRRNDPVAEKTDRVLGALLAWFIIEAPDGGPPPYSTLGRRLDMDRRDIAAIAEAWAGLLYNRAVKGVDAFGEELPQDLARCPAFSQLTESHTVSPAFERGLPTPCPPGNGVEQTALNATPVLALEPTPRTGQNVVLPPSIKDNQNGGVGGRLHKLFLCSRMDAGVQMVQKDGTLTPRYRQHCPDKNAKNPDGLSQWWMGKWEAHLEGRERLSLFPVQTYQKTKNRTKGLFIDFDGQDGLGDATRTMDALSTYDIPAYLQRSWTVGHYHVLIFLLYPAGVNALANRLRGLLDKLGITAEIRPEGVINKRTEGPGQESISMPYFGWGKYGDRDCIIDHDRMLQPIPPEFFLDHLETVDPRIFRRRLPSLNKPEARAKAKRRRGVEAGALADSWPEVHQGEAHQAPNGKMKGGRDDALMGHAGELAALGLTFAEAWPYLWNWNLTKVHPPFPEKIVKDKLKRAIAYQEESR
jgi:hypothetical protein